MKKTLQIFALFILAATATNAQAPQLLNYQGVARTTAGVPIASSPIGLDLKVHDGSAGGTIVYEETQTPTTNTFGLYNVSIGGGTIVSGTLGGINWASGTKYIEVGIDPAGGSSYTSAGTAQLLSAPYAIYANTAGTATSITGTMPMGGDVTGTDAAATVVKLQGQAISSTAPAAGQVLTWNSGSSSWTPTAPALTSTGTTNYIPKFTSATALGNSMLFDNGTSVGLGTITPSSMSKIEVSGTGAYGSLPYYLAGIVADGTTTASASGVYAEGGWRGVYGHNLGTSSGVEAIGVYGRLEGSLYTGTGYGVKGEAFGTGPTNYGVYGAASGATGSNYAGYFAGALYATSASSSIKSFKIDHPADPANKYLYHSSVESNEMMDLYKGNVTTDANGDATVTLPSYFSILNKDYSYQLTCIGQFAQAIVSQKISGNEFKIKTDKPNVEVSWLVGGVRQDPAANAYRIKDEVEKPANEKGTYLMPELYGYGPEKGMGYSNSKDNTVSPK